jgi:hypothetical protein
MDNNTKSVVRGYLSLNAQQRKEVADLIEKQQRGILSENEIRKKDDISMGPSGSGCPCCGR